MYQKVTTAAPAKLNLALDITGRRADGYHEIDTLFQSVDLCDILRLSREERPGIYVSCDRPRLPCDETNLAHIAARQFLQWFGLEGRGVSIDIEKRIPLQAGLGGGSADAAGVLVGLDTLFGTGASLEELARLGAAVGSDVPFCILGGTRRGRGRGELLEQVSPLPDRTPMVIAKPEAGISTAESYRRYDQQGARRRPDLPALLALLEAGETAAFAPGMYNVLQEVAGLPQVTELCQKLMNAGALGAMMSGSGSAVFGLFEGRRQAKHGMRKLFGLAQSVFLVQSVPHGAVVLDCR